jgi:hypothetical protein
VGKTEGTAGLQQAAHRSTFLNFPELVLAVAPGHARPATLTLLASVGCASLARSKGAGKTGAHHGIVFGTVTAARGAFFRNLHVLECCVILNTVESDSEILRILIDQ